MATKVRATKAGKASKGKGKATKAGTAPPYPYPLLVSENLYRSHRGRC
jgi:hypothetical protein